LTNNSEDLLGNIRNSEVQVQQLLIDCQHDMFVSVKSQVYSDSLFAVNV